MKKKTIKTSELINNLLNESLEYIESDLDFTREFLTSQGFDYEEILIDGRKPINKLLNEQLLEFAKKKRVDLVKILNHIELKLFDSKVNPNLFFCT